MDELASDGGRASLKPVLMVAATLVAAVLGAVVTVRPAAHQPSGPAAGVAVIGAPRGSADHRHSFGRPPGRHLSSKAVLD
jgi:hypothetical protein